MRHVIVGTAGHIDHGKSALVKALTGTDPDRLKEEKLRGITIDLGFAHLDLGDVQIGFVDVPGHERFVKNMLAGAGGIDFTLLVVAADESVMPQTREHFDICRLLGIQTGIVVLTKSDLADPEMLDLAREEVAELVRGSFLKDAEVIPVSSKTGHGLELLKMSLHSLALSVQRRTSEKITRLPIDRTFTIRGFGTVVTGTLISGELNKDQEVELLPGGVCSKVRGLQVHGALTGHAVAGQRTAVNLQGVDLEQARRGMVLTPPGMFRTTQLLDVQLSLLPTAKTLNNLLSVRFHQGTVEIIARVALLGTSSVVPGESAFAQLRLDSPVLCVHGDRFIIRQFSPAVTIGGGVILNPHPTKHKSSDLAAISSLRALAEESTAEKISVLVETASGQVIHFSEIIAIFGMQPTALRLACDELVAAGRLIRIAATGDLVSATHLRELENQVRSCLGEYHKNNPLQRGMSREELRDRVFRDLPYEVFKFSMERLVQKQQVSVQEEFVSLRAHRIEFSAEAQKARDRIEAILSGAHFQPPLLSEIEASLDLDPREVRRVLGWMLKEKVLVRIGDDLAYPRLTLEEIKAGIRASLPVGTKFGVADFKELFHLTRKHAIPLLEYLDRERFTRRQGNDRVLI